MQQALDYSEKLEKALGHSENFQNVIGYSETTQKTYRPRKSRAKDLQNL